MRRPDLWAEARSKVESVLAEVTPADEAGLYLFDRQIHPALSIAQWNETDPASRVALLRARLAEASPGWSDTRLGDALAAAADLASENSSAAAGDARSVRQIVLVSDMQEGGKIAALQGHEWPKEVGLRVLPVTAKRPGNASAQWVQASRDQPSAIAPAEGTLRVNVSNHADSIREQFTLVWANDTGVLTGRPIQVYVAPGHSQIVKVPLPADGSVADRLVLAGDDCDFDNTLFLVPPLTETVRVLYVGDDAATDVNALRYYLENALFDTALRKVQFVARGAGEAVADGDLVDTRLAVVTRAPSDPDIVKLRKYVQEGGDVLWVGKDLATTQRAGALLGRELQVKEATGDFALIGRVELTHPLFAPFADARFADFSKIHFWKHRAVAWTAAEGPDALHVLAAFDGGGEAGAGAPFLVEQLIGRGTVRLMTAGWQPADSQLALSSKFVPLLEEMVRRRDALAIGAQYAVGDPIALPAGDGGGEVVRPDGRVTRVASAAAFDGAEMPGVYHWKTGGRDVPFAVNLAADESRTTPIEDPTGALAQLGVMLTSPELTQKLAEQQRILLNNELENRQKAWRWLLLGVLGLLAVETALAGRLSRGASQKGAAT
jgi:hypothetical protein